MEQETRWPILLQTGTTSKRDWPWPCFQPAACLRLISYNNSRANVDVDFCLPILDMMSFSSPFWPKFGALNINFEIVFTSGRILYLFHLNCRSLSDSSNSDIACKGYCLALPFPHIRMMNYVKIFLLRWITLIFTFISMPRQGFFSEVMSAEYRYHLFCPPRKRYTWTKTRYIGRINLFKSAPVQ